MLNRVPDYAHHPALNCLKPLIPWFKLDVWFKPNTKIFQILYETIFDWYESGSYNYK